MPTETVLVCATCKRKGCDGGRWRLVKAVELTSHRDVTTELHADNMVECTWHWLGAAGRKKATGKAVGEKIEHVFTNWYKAARVTLEKVED